MEKSKGESRSDSNVDERDSKGRTGSTVAEPIQRPLETLPPKEAKEVEKVKEEEKKVYTNQQFLEEKLKNCKKFVSSISCLENSALLKSFEELSPREVIQWVITVTNEKKPLDAALYELFMHYKMDATQLKKEEFQKLVAYFHCFQTLVTTNF